MWGDEAAERHEMNEPSEPLAVDGTPRLPATPGELADQKLFERLKARAESAQRDADMRHAALWQFMEDWAIRDAYKPYAICGDQDSWHPRHEEGHPEYDENDLVAGVICQLPANHRDLGYRNHLEMRDGKVWGAWS